MSHDELVEQFAREHRYRGVLVVAAAVGILASAVVGVVLTLGGVEVSRGGGDRASFGLLVLPFATSMLIGSGVHKALLLRTRKRRR